MCSRNSGARAVIVADAALAQRVLPAADQVASVEAIIAIEPPAVAQLSEAELHLWEDVLARGAGEPEEVEGWAGAIGRDDIACLIYTSGTGGAPKGVMTTPRQHPRQLPRRLSPARDHRAR